MPGAGPKPFEEIEQADSVKGSGSQSKSFAEIEQTDEFVSEANKKGGLLKPDAVQKSAEADPTHEPGGEFNFDQVKKIIERKVGDASQLDQAIKTITDILGDTPTIKSNWRDEYMKGSDNGGRVAERKVMDVKQLSEAVRTIKDLLGDDVFMNKTGWRDEYQAQNETETIAKADPFKDAGGDVSEVSDSKKIVKRWSEIEQLDELKTPVKPGWRDEYQAQKRVVQTNPVLAPKTAK